MIVAISFELIPAIVFELVAIWEIFPATTGIPSITYKGSDPALIDPIPLILTSGAAPGWPLWVTIWTPATFPCKDSWKEAIGVSFTLLISISTAEPV